MTTTGEIRPIMETLAQLRKGQVLDDLAFEQNKLIEAVRATGKAGTLTLKLTVKPGSKGDGDIVMVSDAITAKLPELDTKPTLFWTTADNNLTRTNPRQSDLPLQAVDYAQQQATK